MNSLFTVLGAVPSVKPLHQMGGLIVGLLLLASFIVVLLKCFRPQVDFTSLDQRINAWWLMVAIFLLSLLSHPKAAVVLFAFLSFLA